MKEASMDQRSALPTTQTKLKMAIKIAKIKKSRWAKLMERTMDTHMEKRVKKSIKMDLKTMKMNLWTLLNNLNNKRKL